MKLTIFSIAVIILITFNVIDFLMQNEYFSNYEQGIPILNRLYKNKNVQFVNNDKYGKCLIIDKEIQLCTKNEAIYHELIVHLPMLYLNKKVENVLIVGGGDLMTLREVMKYNTIKKVVMLELSPLIVNKSKEYFNVSDFKNDPRVQIIYGDADISIDKLLRKRDLFDACIIDTTEDNSNNLVIDKPPFFKKCLHLLIDDGLLIKNGESFEQIFYNDLGLNVIPYGSYIDYFNTIYKFNVATKNRDIEKIEVKPEEWKKYNIKTSFFKPEDYQKYLVYNIYKFTY
jgi:spermidine synthase